MDAGTLTLTSSLSPELIQQLREHIRSTDADAWLELKLIPLAKGIDWLETRLPCKLTHHHRKQLTLPPSERDPIHIAWMTFRPQETVGDRNFTARYSDETGATLFINANSDTHRPDHVKIRLTGSECRRLRQSDGGTGTAAARVLLPLIAETLTGRKHLPPDWETPTRIDVYADFLANKPIRPSDFGYDASLQPEDPDNWRNTATMRKKRVIETTIAIGQRDTVFSRTYIKSCHPHFQVSDYGNLAEAMATIHPLLAARDGRTPQNQPPTIPTRSIHVVDTSESLPEAGQLDSPGLAQWLAATIITHNAAHHVVADEATLAGTECVMRHELELHKPALKGYDVMNCEEALRLVDAGTIWHEETEHGVRVTQGRDTNITRDPTADWWQVIQSAWKTQTPPTPPRRTEPPESTDDAAKKMIEAAGRIAAQCQHQTGEIISLDPILDWLRDVTKACTDWLREKAKNASERTIQRIVDAATSRLQWDDWRRLCQQMGGVTAAQVLSAAYDRIPDEPPW